MSPGSVKVYTNVQLFPRLNFDKHTPYYMMRLDYKHDSYLRRINWDKSKRLLYGNLLLLTKNNFDNVYFAAICTRDNKKLQDEGIFGITWEGVKPEFCAESYFDIVECDVYFESYRHTLTALQGIELGDFPMARYIVDADVNHKLPSYIEKIDKLVSFKTLILGIHDKSADDYGLADIRDVSTWPSADELGMDSSQYTAFCAALTREITIIQGPPGTGKTFIGIQIAKFLLTNQQYVFPQQMTSAQGLQGDGRPVLIVCYTNHALDQFLEEIMKIMLKLGMQPQNEMIRVGGQTKSVAMKDILLHARLDTAKQERLLPHRFHQNLITHKSNLSRVKGQRFRLMDCLRTIKESTSILDLLTFFERDPGFSGDNQLSSYCGIDPDDVDVTWTEALFLTILRKHEIRWMSFGLSEFNFYNKDFNPFSWMQRIFRNRFQALFYERQKIVTPIEVMKPEVQAEDEFDENYDRDELITARIQEIQYEMDFDSAQRQSGFQPKYLIHSSTDPVKSPSSQLSILLDDLNVKIGRFNCQKSKENHSLVCCAEHIYLEELKRCQRQYMTVKEVVQAYHDNKLILTDITESELGAIVKNMQNGSLPSPLETWTAYFQILIKCRNGILKLILKLEDELVNLDQQHKEAENSCYSLLLNQAKFVGMTTTGAAKNNTLLQNMRSKLVIVEEAAEVLESHVITCLTEHCEHLILIGDHKQLRPKTAMYKLAKQYNLDISLFERMINNDLNLYRLEVQHRMRPEICDLIVPTIYDKLENHESVFTYPKVAGVESNLYFISHKEKETDETDSTSRSNLHEATFLVRLCRHFRLQGYSSDRITIITTYVGQMFLIKKIIRKDEICQDVRVTVVDNFQGEENDIILLSLVRSNEDNKIGFLKTENRICVALSRAKQGFYVMGNMDSMASSSSTWKTIIEKLTLNDTVGPQFSLKCQIHGDIIQVMKSTDFDKAPEGGCSKMCETELERCGHICQLVCHILDKNHVEYKCRFPCDKKCEKNGHRCPRDCYELCPKCSVPVDVLLGCGHTETLQCYWNETTYLCTVRVIKTLPCTHERQMQCHENPATICCQVKILNELSCGHKQEASCSTKIESIECISRIEVEIPACEHLLEIMCFQKNQPEKWICGKLCDTRLECGHACTKYCHTDKDPNHDNYTCRKDCAKSCHNEHKCGEYLVHNHKCSTPCPNCEVVVKITLQCGHDAEVPCFASLDPSSVRCSVDVKKSSLDCPHSFVVPCSDYATKLKCQELVVSHVASLCGHAVEVACRIQDTVTPEELLVYCQMPCGVELKLDEVGCQHLCNGSCSTCFRGRIHQKCTAKCERVLICGHVCTYPCSAVCPPCKQKCGLKCKHSKCKFKCGTPCSSCKEPCEWKCEHKNCTKLCGEQCNRTPCDVPCPLKLRCGHPCVGLCSEPCPPKCRICDEDDLKEILFGNEDEPDVRFVYLVDCKHTVEVEGLDKWMLEGSATDPKKNTLQVKKCPKCSTTIRTSLRYSNILKTSYADVIKVKTHIFGKQVKTQYELRQLVGKFERGISSSPKSLVFFVIYMSNQIYKTNFNPFFCKLVQKRLDDRIEKVDQYVLESLMNLFAWWEEASLNLQTSIKYENLQPSIKDEELLRRFYNNKLVPSASNQRGMVKNSLSLTCSTDLRKRYNEQLTLVMKREVPLSHLEIKQLSLEFKRLSDLFQLYRRYSVEHFEELNMERLCDEAKKMILEAPVYDNACVLAFEKCLKEIDRLMKLSLSEVSRASVVAIYKAVGYSGSWYKCPNGHVYSIGNCGQPNETARCPDCKATIGAGTHHQPAVGNLRIAGPSQPPPVEGHVTPDFLQ